MLIYPITNYHSQLLGLDADDHTQYLLVDGTRALGGDWNLGDYDLTQAGNISGAGLFFNTATIDSSVGVQLTLQYGLLNTATFETDSSGNLTILASGGNISLGNENLSTTGIITALTFNATNTADLFQSNGSTILRNDGTNSLSLGIGAGGGTSGVFIGNSAGNGNTAENAICIGFSSGGQGGAGMTGTSNTFIGRLAGNKIVDGIRNFGLGSQALQHTVASDDNVAIGSNAMENFLGSATLGSNIAIGAQSMLGAASGTGYQNVFIGTNTATGISSGNRNVGVGYQALTGLTTGDRNIAIGLDAGFSTTSADYSSYIGVDCGRGANASENNCLGFSAGKSLTSGGSNVIIGSSAGRDNLTTGTKNTILGFNTGRSMGNFSNCVLLGSHAGQDADADNILVIDNQDRTSAALTKTNAILYGTMDAAPANQVLTVNANLKVGNTTTGQITQLGDGGTTNYTQISATGNVTLPAGAIGTGRAPLYFQDGTALTTPVAGALEFHDGRLYATNVLHRRALDRTSDVAVATVTVADTTTETTIWTAIMNANSLVAGNMFKFHANGIVSNGDSASSADQVTLRIKVGGTTVATLAPALKKIPVDSHWHITANATQRTLTDGATLGKRAVHIDLDIDDETSAVLAIADIDTEADMDVTVTAEWASADAANTISLYQGFMEYKN